MIILTTMAICVLVVGAMTFADGSETASTKHEYGPLATSTIMVIAGSFCAAFFSFGLNIAIGVAMICAIIMFCAHTITSYAVRKAYSLEAGKAMERACAEPVRDDERERVEVVPGVEDAVA